MAKEVTLLGPNKDFESIKKINKQAVEYWEARELMPLLGYKNWRDFENSIKKAKIACEKSEQKMKDHFVYALKMIKIAKNTVKEATSELAANLFRITQTDEKIIKEKISGEEKANTTHFDVGNKVRKTIEEIGGTMPENLKPEKHIKKIKAKGIKMIKNKKLNEK